MRQHPRDAHPATSMHSFLVLVSLEVERCARGATISRSAFEHFKLGLAPNALPFYPVKSFAQLPFSFEYPRAHLSPPFRPFSSSVFIRAARVHRRDLKGFETSKDARLDEHSDLIGFSSIFSRFCRW